MKMTTYTVVANKERNEWIPEDFEGLDFEYFDTGVEVNLPEDVKFPNQFKAEVVIHSGMLGKPVCPEIGTLTLYSFETEHIAGAFAVADEVLEMLTR